MEWIKISISTELVRLPVDDIVFVRADGNYSDVYAFHDAKPHKMTFKLHYFDEAFRQFVLVSNGELPARFHLHGKVERRAIGRMADDTLYYIVTPHPETMWDFADALRELGFIDAIYITGGAMPTWWRTSDGKRHVIGTPASPAPRRAASHAPWLVLLRASSV